MSDAIGEATFDTKHRDNIVCPYCGYEDEDSWAVDFGPGIDGETELQCASCGQAMKAKRYSTVAYTTEKLPKEEGGHADHPDERDAEIRGASLTVVLRNPWPMHAYNDPPTHRSVSIELTPEQCAQIKLKFVGTVCGQKVFESVSQVFLGSEVCYE
jgi:DNA-directed RNA polymerase subunit RPC12/RpoP